MPDVLGVCGLDCTACGGYQATQANDLAAKERVVAQWREEYHNPAVDVAYVTCDGCTAGGRLGGHCLECNVRACGTARGLATCGDCGEYSSCATIADFVAFVPRVKATLDAAHLRRLSLPQA